MRIIYVVRADKDYQYQGIISPYFLHQYHTKEIVDAWNKTFNVSWYQFRLWLNALREDNVKDLEIDEHYYLYELAEKIAKLNLDIQDFKDCIAVPTDDDDWFHPDLFPLLKTLPKQNRYRWNFAEVRPKEFYQYHNMKLTSMPTFTCTKLTIYPENNYPKYFPKYLSNNYALYFPQNLGLIACHGEADQEFNLPDDPCIDKCLSIHPLHLSSISFLEYFYEKNINLLELLPRLLKVYQEPIVLPNDTPQYFIPFFEKLTSLYQRLSIK